MGEECNYGVRNVSLNFQLLSTTENFISACSSYNFSKKKEDLLSPIFFIMSHCVT